MRELKFRARNENDTRWIYWTMGYTFDENLDVRTMQYIDFETTVQYTGLKDTKRTKEYPDGQEIYEGDIWKHRFEVIPKKAGYKKVILKHGCFGFIPIFPKLCHPDDIGFKPFYDQEDDVVWEGEVIGNIHENPELME